MYLALYKGKGLIGNYLTRWWTGSVYSHCELVVDGECYSASFMDGGVRKKTIDLASGRWDVIPLDSWMQARVVSFFKETEGKQYDWWGIIGAQMFNRRRHDPNRFFCSEWCAAALGIPNSEMYTPHTLAELLAFINKNLSEE